MAIANTVKLQGGQLTQKLCGWDIVGHTPSLFRLVTKLNHRPGP